MSDLDVDAGYPSNLLLPYPAGMILLVEVGSTAHGTGLPGGEDHDETAVVIETPQAVFCTSGTKNSMKRTQPEGTRSGPGDVDRQIYSLRSFIALAAAGNPSIQLVLYAPVLETTNLGIGLRDLAPLFIGRHIVPRYRGYMRSQIMRMQGLRGNGHGKRGGGKREELITAHGYDTKYAMHAARLGFQCLELMTQGQLELPIGGEPGEWLRSVRRGEIKYEEWLERAEGLDLILSSLETDNSFRKGPVQDKIDQWVIRAHQECWDWK